MRSIAGAAAAITGGAAVGTASADDDYEVIEATGQTITIGEGETLENKLVDLTDGGSLTLLVEGGDSTIRNVGFDGLYRGSEFQLSIAAPSGDVLIENLYLGDGATKEGEGFVHGPGAVFYHNDAACDVTFRYCNVQGYPNNGFYCSNTASGGSVMFENCYAKNNGVATYRCGGANDAIRNSVAYNDDTDYGPGYGGYTETNGRPVWSSGLITIEDSDFAGGDYPHALVSHQGGTIEFDSGAVSGGMEGSVQTGDVGDDPDLSIPDGVPTTAEEAASGAATDGVDTN
ncbi:hypothetical protein C493_21856 [Natronolimnohabitans innermongolicus JCM 12255]|uniref:Right handed beta helix domain-containing protein n=1 Tax=Natronolimnohabitans innermongolicus JCM 12255 TaxID=1227499 RepID=L9WJT1_9EURY|nr:hypothetical protein C493_21856 [Natronolimnohabitans innermongolicus JCM 12255]